MTDFRATYQSYRLNAWHDHMTAMGYELWLEMQLNRALVGANELEQVIAAKQERIAELEAAINKVLDDEEADTGWGPDVTTVQYLRSVVKREVQS